LGRATQGVTLIALDDGSTLSGLQRIVENDANVDATLAAAAEASTDTPTNDTPNETPPSDDNGQENT
jgi:DNA gyrase subunit A